MKPAEFTLAPEAVRVPAGMGSHQRAVGGTDEWLTPPGLLQRLGPFDLDPCSPVQRPWDTARRHYSALDNGLHQPWEGRVWLNPPYSTAEAWLQRLAKHGHGTALIFARTETASWQQWVWPQASAILFLRGRLKFHLPTGGLAAGNAGAPSALVAYGPSDAERLLQSRLSGFLCYAPFHHLLA